MSAQTRELIEVLFALSPYVIVIVLLAWSAIAGLRDERGSVARAVEMRNRRIPADRGGQDAADVG